MKSNSKDWDAAALDAMKSGRPFDFLHSTDVAFKKLRHAFVLLGEAVRKSLPSGAQ